MSSQTSFILGAWNKYRSIKTSAECRVRRITDNGRNINNKTRYKVAKITVSKWTKHFDKLLESVQLSIHSDSESINKNHSTWVVTPMANQGDAILACSHLKYVSRCLVNINELATPSPDPYTHWRQNWLFNLVDFVASVYADYIAVSDNVLHDVSGKLAGVATSAQTSINLFSA